MCHHNLAPKTAYLSAISGSKANNLHYFQIPVCENLLFEHRSKGREEVEIDTGLEQSSEAQCQ